jgi:S1-C subfamily serine protease
MMYQIFSIIIFLGLGCAPKVGNNAAIDNETSTVSSGQSMLGLSLSDMQGRDSAGLQSLSGNKVVGSVDRMDTNDQTANVMSIGIKNTEMNAFSYQDVAERFDSIKPAPVTRGLVSDLYEWLAPKVVRIMTSDGVGSGVVVGSDGAILTNLHNLGDETSAWVYYKPEKGKKPTKRYKANLVKYSATADLALLSVESPANVEPVGFADSSSIRVGDDVIAIGHPYGEVWTLTKGIISQYREDYTWQYDENAEYKATVIQTQTPINPGNSGGPLFAEDGGLVGINTMGGRGEGMNFAVSVATIVEFMNSPQEQVARPVQASEQDVDFVPWGDSNDDGVTDVWAWDKDGDGKHEIFAVDKDYDGQEDVFMVDKDLNDEFELMIVPYDDRTLFYYDYDQNGDWDEVGFDIDGDWEPDSFETIYKPEECRTMAKVNKQCRPDSGGVQELEAMCKSLLSESVQYMEDILGCVRESSVCSNYNNCTNDVYSRYK